MPQKTSSSTSSALSQDLLNTEKPLLSTQSKLSPKVWIMLLLLGFAGQLAWAVENQFFNTFLYDKITPDPRAVSWMVAVTALVSTLTTIFMGTLSDRTRSRWGKRRPYLFLGYILWGIFTALFPLAAKFHPVSLGIFMAILFDSIMSFFGATASDAAFSAYATEITTDQNRGRVTGSLEIMKWLAMLIVYGGAGFIIQEIGYYWFFYIIGGLAAIIGAVCVPNIPEEIQTEKPEGTYWEQIVSTFQFSSLRQNRDFFLVLISLTLFMGGINIFFPYLLIYLQHYIQLSITDSSILVGLAILIGGIILAYPIGLLVDRWGRRQVALISVIFESLGLVLFSFSHSLVPLVITGIIWLAASGSLDNFNHNLDT